MVGMALDDAPAFAHARLLAGLTRPYKKNLFVGGDVVQVLGITAALLG